MTEMTFKEALDLVESLYARHNNSFVFSWKFLDQVLNNKLWTAKFGSAGTLDPAEHYLLDHYALELRAWLKLQK